MATYGYADGNIVPTSGQEMARTQEGRMSIQEAGTPELIEALAELSRAGQRLVDRHQAEPLPRGWGSLLKAPEPRRRKAVGTWSELLFSKLKTERTYEKREKLRSDKDKAMRYTHRIPWVMEGPAAEKPAVISAAKAVCVATGGQAVLVMIRIPSARRREEEIKKEPTVEIGYKAMLVVPRPTRVKSKNGRTFFDWRPVVVEPTAGTVKTYRIDATEIFVANSSDPDDYRIDQTLEIKKLTRIAQDLAKSLRNQTKIWMAAFRVETATQNRASARGYVSTVEWFIPGAIAVAIAVMVALHGGHWSWIIGR